ncbi:MAG TPA: CARDB domain-containing protein, partial [Afifellaceae bacterium]|nr:CARDB domain-containing protein [Afifellaceae bacterium]
TNPAYPNAVVIAVPALAMGKVYSFKLPFWNGLVWPSGNFRFTVTADAGGIVAETNEGNNQKAAVMTVP